MRYRIINRKKKFATILADIFGYALWTPINIFKKRALPLTNIREILVIRTAYIGDVVMTLPILKPLKELYPNSRITFLTCASAKDAFLNNPYVDAVLAYDAFWFYPRNRKEGIKDYLRFLKLLRSKTYDLVIEARADIRDILLLAYLSKSRYRVSYSAGGGGYLLTHVIPYKKIQHRIDYHLDIVRYLGSKDDEIEWDLYLDPEEKDRVNEFLTRQGIGQKGLLVGVHPGSRKELKTWLPDRFAQLTDMIITEYGAQVIFTGSPQEEKFIDGILSKMRHTAINLAGKTDLRLLAGIIKKLDLFISNDSAPLHIASAMRTPTVAIFGPSKSRETGPYHNIHRVVEKDFPCRCSCDEDVCKHHTFKECMGRIEVNDVMEAVRSVSREVQEGSRHKIA